MVCFLIWICNSININDYMHACFYTFLEKNNINIKLTIHTIFYKTFFFDFIGIYYICHFM